MPLALPGLFCFCFCFGDEVLLFCGSGFSAAKKDGGNVIVFGRSAEFIHLLFDHLQSRPGTLGLTQETRDMISLHDDFVRLFLGAGASFFFQHFLFLHTQLLGDLLQPRLLVN